jgi:hypothetical protein
LELTTDILGVLALPEEAALTLKSGVFLEDASREGGPKEQELTKKGPGADHRLRLRSSTSI